MPRLLFFPHRAPALVAWLEKAYIHGHYRLNAKTGQRHWVDSYQDKRPERGRASFTSTDHRVQHFDHHLTHGRQREALHVFHDLDHDESHKLALRLGLMHQTDPKGVDKKDLLESLHGAVRAKKAHMMKVGPYDKEEDAAFGREEKARKKPVKIVRAAEKPAEHGDKSDEKDDSGYSLPEQKPFNEWIKHQHKDFTPTKRQQLVMDSAARAMDSGLFYNTQVNDFIARELGVTPEQRAVNTENVVDGNFGSDVYYARRAVEAQRKHKKEGDVSSALNLKPGDTLGTLVLSDGKRTTGVTVTSIESDGSVVATGKRGSVKVQITMPILAVQQGLDRTKERGKRPDGYDEFVARRAAAPAPTPKPASAPASAKDEAAAAKPKSPAPDIAKLLKDPQTTRTDLDRALLKLTNRMNAALRANDHVKSDALEAMKQQVRDAVPAAEERSRARLAEERRKLKAPLAKSLPHIFPASR